MQITLWEVELWVIGKEGVGVLYPNVTSDGIAATSSGTTVATFTSSGTNDALRVGGASNYATIGSTGSLTFNAVTNDIVTGTNEHLALMPNGTGNVGIGTTGPTGKLHVLGTTRIQSGQDAGSLIIGADNSVTTLTDATDKAARVGVPHYTNAEEPLAAWVGSTGSVNNSISFGGGTSVMNAATLLSFYTAANTTTVTGTERMRIDSAGNVGIGTTVPLQPLDVNGFIRSRDTFEAPTDCLETLIIRGAGNFVVPEMHFCSRPGAAAGHTTIGVAPTGVADATPSWTWAVNINNTNGNVGIGSTSPTTFKLEVAGNIGPDADNTRDLGSSSRYYANIYANNIVGSGALGYWKRGVRGYFIRT